MSVSDSLVYVPKPNAVAGHKFRQNVFAYNGTTFQPGQTMMFNIPTGRRGQYMNPRMSYLRFTLQNTGGNPITPDLTASSVISRLSLYHGSNLLEDIQEYNVLHNLWTDMTGENDVMRTSSNVMEGGDNNRAGLPVAGNSSRVYCVPLLSGIVGTLQSKYLPVGALIGDMRLELVLEDQVPAVVGDSTWSVTGVELMLETTELATDAAMMIEQANPGGYLISFDSFVDYTNAVANGSSSANILVPARFSSLKTLFSVMRDASKVQTAGQNSISDRVQPFGATGQWYYSIGGKNIPATPVKNSIEAYAELSKALHAFGTVNHTSLITNATWAKAANATDSTYVIAQDLEHLPHKSRLQENGINTLSVNTHLIMDFGQPVTANVRVNTFAHFDGILIIQNGIATVRF